jgi:arabinogalactan oligomer/maltooligosaccharide transport system permease protein
MFSQWLTDFKTGDIYVKLSLLFMSIGFFRRHQIIKGILFSILQIGFILFMIFTGVPNLSKYNTLGTIQFESVYNPITRRNEVNDYDHSFKILLYGLISIIVIFTYIFNSIFWVFRTLFGFGVEYLKGL